MNIRGRKIRLSRIILWGFLLCFVAGIGWFYCFVNAKPTISVNYVEKYNDLTRPANYDPNDNAWLVYEKCIRIPRNRAFVSDDFPLMRNLLPLGSYQRLQKWNELFEKDWNALRLAFDRPICWMFLKGDNLSCGFDPLDHCQRLKGLSVDILTRSRIQFVQGNLNGSFETLSCYVRMLTQLSNSHNPNLQGLTMEMRTALYSVLQKMLWFDRDNPTLYHLIRQLMNSVEPAETIEIDIIQMVAEDCLQRTFTDNGFGNGHSIPGQFVIGYGTGGGRYIGTPMGWKKWLSPIHWKFYLTDVVSDIQHNLLVYSSAFFGDDRIQTQNKVHAVFQDFREGNIPDRFQYISFLQQHSGPRNPENPAFWYICSCSIGQYLNGFSDQKEDASAFAAVMTIVALVEYFHLYRRYPETLDELVEGMPNCDLPKDPFSGKWLNYKKTEKSFVLYSVGYDGIDQGGRQDGSNSYNHNDYVYWPIPISPFEIDFSVLKALDPNEPAEYNLTSDPNLLPYTHEMDQRR